MANDMEMVSHQASVSLPTGYGKSIVALCFITLQCCVIVDTLQRLIELSLYACRRYRMNVMWRVTVSVIAVSAPQAPNGVASPEVYSTLLGVYLLQNEL